jgi:hypothetical protein
MRLRFALLLVAVPGVLAAPVASASLPRFGPWDVQGTVNVRT